jgi:hypothetical protein
MSNIRHFGGKGISLDGDAPLLIISDDDSSGDCGVFLREDKSHGLPTDATGDVYGTFIKYVAADNKLDIVAYNGDITVPENKHVALSLDRVTGHATLPSGCTISGNQLPAALGTLGYNIQSDGAGGTVWAPSGVPVVAIDHTTTTLTLNCLYVIDMSGASGNVTFTFPDMVTGDQFKALVYNNTTNGFKAIFKTTTPQNMRYREKTDIDVRLDIPDTWIGGAWDNNNSYVAIYDASTFLSGNLAGSWIVENDLTVGGDLTVDTDTLVVDATNNRVGVNTVPSNTFHVKSSPGEIFKIESTGSEGVAQAYAGFWDAGAARRGYIGFAGNNDNMAVKNNRSGDLDLKTAGGGMTVDSSGNVGINQPTPAEKLDLYAGSMKIQHTGGTTYFTDFHQFGGWDGRMKSVSTSSGMGWDVTNLAETGSRNLLLQSSGGAVGIGVAPSSGMGLHINNGGLRVQSINSNATDGGALRVSGPYDSGVIYQYSSSKKYKDNIRPLEVDSSLIYDFDAKTYEPKGTDKTTFGYIAESIMTIVPNLVPLREDGEAYGVSYDRIVVLIVEEMKILVKENKEQQSIIESLTSRIEKLEGKI